MNRYSGIKQLRNVNENLGVLGAKYFSNLKYPEIPYHESDIYVITEFGDRLDILSNQFYKDITLYWIIAIANPDVINFGSIYIEEGTQLRIPLNINQIINSYKSLNSV
jgi:hypothetical protein